MTSPFNSPLEPPPARRLVRSTIVALVVAGLLLVAVVLPAEYGIDPTGVGRVLGLTRMGEIKTRLAKEAAADAAADAAAAAAEDAAAASEATAVPTANQDSSTIPLPR
jgi:threonine/homoserine efflux transporter RhtA